MEFSTIHINFPSKVLTYTITADVLAKMKHNSADMLSETLNLKENVKRLKFLVARRVPKRFKESGEATIKDLISKGVLDSALQPIPRFHRDDRHIPPVRNRFCTTAAVSQR